MEIKRDKQEEEKEEKKKAELSFNQHQCLSLCTRAYFRQIDGRLKMVKTIQNTEQC